jgi:hypothetical protein
VLTMTLKIFSWLCQSSLSSKICRHITPLPSVSLKHGTKDHTSPSTQIARCSKKVVRSPLLRPYPRP